MSTCVIFFFLALAVNFVLFSHLQNLCTRIINNVNMFSGVFFIWNEIDFDQTFTINIESSLIHSINIFLLLAWYPVLAVFKKAVFVLKLHIYLMKNQSFFNFQIQYFPVWQTVTANAALRFIAKCLRRSVYGCACV